MKRARCPFHQDAHSTHRVNCSLLPLASCLLPLASCLFFVPCSRFPIPDSRFPIAN
ncbi:MULTISPECIES: hypothetical protein [unclassified Moorena]|uniref:hypothetical protein n=1 Tax=unclassified Moorena TaxID=2683338 RepID=UPI001400729B|nr:MULTISPECIES: hypothetical protein [unclassified Moorena]NEO11165.1 hypothetical protein [Moorena sp. SIO3E8]NEQ00100.1 hypothetical protein [Moorena sp. SIO3F7]